MLLYTVGDEDFIALHAGGTVGLNGIDAMSFSGALNIAYNRTGNQIVDFGEYGEIDFEPTRTWIALVLPGWMW